MKYHCVFPDCQYETDDRSLIEFHHIHPKELGVKLNKDVTIPLCPTHHKMIYYPGSKSGQHSVQKEGSLTVVQVATTTSGKAVIFRDVAGNDITVSIDVKRPKPDAIYVLKWDLVHGIAESEVDECDSYAEVQVDAKGYCQAGNAVYFSPGHRHIAADLLKKHIEHYMIQTKSEYENALAKARADWKSL
jgi:hypothetical protein